MTRRVGKRRAIAAITAFLGAIGLMLAYATLGSAQTEAAGDRAQVVLKDVDGQAVAAVTMRELPQGGVLLEVRTRGLPPGFHGFHVHTVGKCDPNAIDPATKKKAPFMSAGGHLNPEKENHPGHAGALPVLLVNGGGEAAMSVVTDRFTIAELLDADGSSMVIHASPDNFANIPERYTASATQAPSAKAASKSSSVKDSAKAAATDDADNADASKDASKKAAAAQSTAKAAKKPGPDASTLMTGDAGARIACGVIQKA